MEHRDSQCVFLRHFLCGHRLLHLDVYRYCIQRFYFASVFFGRKGHIIGQELGYHLTFFQKAVGLGDQGRKLLFVLDLFCPKLYFFLKCTLRHIYTDDRFFRFDGIDSSRDQLLIQPHLDHKVFVFRLYLIHMLIFLPICKAFCLIFLCRISAVFLIGIFRVLRLCQRGHIRYLFHRQAIRHHADDLEVFFRLYGKVQGPAHLDGIRAHDLGCPVGDHLIIYLKGL